MKIYKITEASAYQGGTMQKELMTADDLAKYLSVHTITVYRMIKDTDIPITAGERKGI